MIGKTLIAIMMIVDKWWYALLMSLVLWYCLWIFATAVDAYLVNQMNFWSQNLGM